MLTLTDDLLFCRRLLIRNGSFSGRKDYLVEYHNDQSVTFNELLFILIKSRR